MRHPKEESLFGAASLIAGFSVLAMVGGLLAVAAQIDRETRRHEEVVVANGFNAHMLEIAALVVPQTNWDDAVRNLALKFNREWAHANEGSFLGGTDRFEVVAIVDPHDQPVYGWRGGHKAAPDEKVGLAWGGRR